MTATALFGTDGIRGRANSEPMTATTALLVAMAAGTQFRTGDHRHSALIGKDTRLSGYMLEPALTAGLVAVGMDVLLVGPLPTPAIAMLTRSMRADLGIMISASHNPFEDNGIKLFGPDGHKLSDAVEAAIARTVASVGAPQGLVEPKALGRVRRLDDAAGRYIEFAKAAFPRSARLDGWRVVIDCAHGAAYKVAPTVLWELGADVISLGVHPDGLNINRACGATAPEALARAVVAERAQIGIALDGDADRVIIVDETGAVVDGDQIMAMIATNWARDGRLAKTGIVATVMSNLGLERHLAGHGIALHRTRVGDRYVVEAMRAGGFNLGGEQSGHIVLSDFATTGDGLIAALQVLACLVETGAPASLATRRFAPLPQILRNLPLKAPERVLGHAGVRAAIGAAERELATSGRLLIRQSGTENLVRLMVEAEDPAVVDAIATRLETAMRSADR